MSERETQKHKSSAPNTIKYDIERRIRRLIDNCDHTKRSGSDGHQKPKTTPTDRLQTFCMICLVLLTAAYASVALNQAWHMQDAVIESQRMRESSDKSSGIIIGQMQKQSDELKRTAEANMMIVETSKLLNRAYLNFANPEIFPYPRTGEPVTTGATVVLVNDGNMRAHIISVRSGWINGKEHAINPFPSAKLSEVSVPKFMGPKQVIPLQGTEIPIGIYKQAKEMKINIFYLMEVKYRDGLDKKKTRVTKTSRSLRFDVYGGTSQGIDYNCTDEDCPQHN